MYKQILISLIWLKGTLLFSQISNVKVDYSVIVDKDDIYEKNVERNAEDSFISQSYLEALQEYKDYTFTLLKNDTITEFYLSQYKEKETKKNKPFVMAGYTGVIYQTKEKVYRFSITENLFAYFDFYKDWKITSETKVIDGYTCYKALGINQITYKDLVFNHQITAWFCPDLPYSIGPMGYGGLPGLILEIRIRNATYLATKIEMNTNDIVDIQFFNKYKKITVEELNRKIDQEIEDAERNRRSKN
jgi:GLPGLI family protein